jgi:drug/metabolite transporter (DMT)-like permease
MKTVLQVLFGFVLGVTGVIVCVFLGLVLKGQPDWHTGVMVLLLLAAAQWVSFFSFRRHIALQVLFGSTFCMAVAVGLLYSSVPLFWESEDQPHVYSVTWRSDVVFLLLVVITQGISFLVFRSIKRDGKGPSDGTTIPYPHR